MSARSAGTGLRVRGTRLVHTSGCFVYGDHPDAPIDETTPHTPSPLGVGHAAEVAELRVIGDGRNHWSCIHVDDLAACTAAVERAPAGAEYDVVDGAPVTVRALVDAVTDGLGRPRVGTVPPWVMGALLGRPLVASLVTSFRMRGERVRDGLGWSPRHPTVADGLVPTLAALER